MRLPCCPGKILLLFLAFYFTLQYMKKFSIVIGIISALLFGIATPIGKILIRDIHPFQLAGLLYLGAFVGVLPIVLRKGRWKISLKGQNRKPLKIAGAVFFGGLLAPPLVETAIE